MGSAKGKHTESAVHVHVRNYDEIDAFFMFEMNDIPIFRSGISSGNESRSDDRKYRLEGMDTVGFPLFGSCDAYIPELAKVVRRMPVGHELFGVSH